MSEPIEYPIRIFIGTSASEWLPAKILEYSILIHTKFKVEFVHLSELVRNIPLPVQKKNHPRTPFSFQRFLIPELCKYHGRAIYLDADMLVFNDINYIWSANLDGADLLYVKNRIHSRLPQFSVMLLDCRKLHWNIEKIINELDSQKYSYDELMYEMTIASTPRDHLLWSWNSMEYYEDGCVNLLHYTDMNIQPWANSKNPNCQLWVDALRSAVSNNFISLADVEKQITSGYVRPSLVLDLRADTTARKTIFQRIRYFFYDLRFAPPYKKLKKRFVIRLISRIFN